MDDRWAAAYVGSMIAVACAGIAILGSFHPETLHPGAAELPLGAGPAFPITVGTAVGAGVGCSLLAGRSRPPGARAIATIAWFASTALFALVVIAAIAGAIDGRRGLGAAYAGWLLGLALASASAWIRSTVVPRLLVSWPDPVPPTRSALLDAWPTSVDARGTRRSGADLPT